MRQTKKRKQVILLPSEDEKRRRVQLKNVIDHQLASNSQKQTEGKTKRKRRQIQRSNAEPTLTPEKGTLVDNARKIIYSIDTDYGMVIEWLKRIQKGGNGHAGMTDPDSDGEDIYDSTRDSIFMHLEAIIDKKDEVVIDVERREVTNHAFLRKVMSSKGIPEDADDAGYSIEEKEKMRSINYLSERDWEESYMRPPLENKQEQECVMGDRCYGLKIENAKGGFIMMAYHLRHEVLEHELNGTPLPQNRMCIFDLRNEMLKYYLDSCADQRVFDKNTSIQLIRNSIRDYHPDFMIIGERRVRRGLPDPIVIQTTSSSHYQYVEESGHKFYRQLIPRPTEEQQKHFLM